MSKPKVVIHIGPMKTGTSALGYYLSTATAQGVLPENVIYPTGELWFPPAGNITKHNALFDFIATESNKPIFRKTAIQNPQDVEERLRRTAAEATRRGNGSTVVFVSETLAGRKEVDKIVEMFEKYFDSITVVLAIRSPAASGMSHLVHRIKDWRHEQLDLDLLAFLSAGGRDFGRHFVSKLARWSAFSNVKLVLIPYLENETDGYASVDRFYHVVTGEDAPRIGGDFGNRRVHPSLPLAALKQLIFIKKFAKSVRWSSFLTAVAHKLFLWILGVNQRQTLIAGFSSRQSSGGNWELSSTERDEIRRAYAPSYEAITTQLGAEAQSADWKRWFAAEGV